MNKTKVLLCGPSSSAMGGGPTHIRNLLNSTLTARYQLIHFETGSRGAESPAKDESPIHKAARLVRSPFALGWAIFRSGARIVHLNSVLDHKALWRDAVYALVSKLFGCKVVLQMHGGSLPELCRVSFICRIVRSVLAIPDLVVLLATQERRDFAQWRMTDRVVVIPNGVDIRAYQEVARTHSCRIVRLAYLGRLVRSKGVFEAVVAIELLRAEPAFKEVQLLIAGSGPDEVDLAREIQGRQLSDCVRLVGPLYGQEKVDFLCAADAFVFPTYHREGLPYCILESLAVGTPVITTSIAGIPDVVVDQVHGKLIEPRDPAQIAEAVRELSTLGPALQRMSRECTARVAEGFSLERFARRFEEVYGKLDVPRGVAGAASN